MSNIIGGNNNVRELANAYIEDDRQEIAIYEKEKARIQQDTIRHLTSARKDTGPDLFTLKSRSFGEIFGVNSNCLGFSPHFALRFYADAAPVKIAVDRIADQFETVPLVVKNRRGDIIEHPVLDLLSVPNASTILSEFLKALAIYYSVSGNVFVMATGDLNRPPLELFVINPAVVSLNPSLRDPFPETIRVSITGGEMVFKRDTRIPNPTRIRFVADGNKEIWHIKDFTPFANHLWGMSAMHPLLLELEQYLNASIHNKNLLRRGATISGIFSLEDSESLLDAEQRDAIRSQINSFYSGAQNAGNAFLASKLKFQPITQNNRDMDFGALRKAVSDTIITGLKVPLPLITTDNITFSNMGTANLLLYDQAVSILAKRLFRELSLFLLPRYSNSERLAITFDESKVPALEPRRNEELNKVKDLNILTPNELRRLLGFDPLPSGGDVLYIPANTIPIGEDNAASETSPSTSNTQESVATSKEITEIEGCDGQRLLSSATGTASLSSAPGAKSSQDKMKLAYGDNIATDETTRQ